MQFEIISISRLYIWIRENELLREDPMHVGTLLLGDRIWCCDEAVAGIVDDEIAGVATIAPYGEEHNPSMVRTAQVLGEETSVGQPTIVALYVRKVYRHQGYGRQVMEATIKRCQKRGFAKVRVDVLSKHAVRIVNSLPAELRKGLDVYDFSGGMDFEIFDP